MYLERGGTLLKIHLLSFILPRDPLTRSLSTRIFCVIMAGEQGFDA